MVIIPLLFLEFRYKLHKYYRLKLWCTSVVFNQIVFLNFFQILWGNVSSSVQQYHPLNNNNILGHNTPTDIVEHYGSTTAESVSQASQNILILAAERIIAVDQIQQRRRIGF